MRKYKNGVVLGKFLPPHFGHCYLIEAALAHAEKVTLLVYTMKTEPLQGMLRAEALKQHFQGRENLEIIWVEKLIPQNPDEHPDFWNIWMKEISSKVSGKIDCMFGSEEYVKTLGEVLDCDHMIIDIERNIVPTSGTACRANTILEWENIIPEFRHNIVKKICFIGGESTGKSTMTKVMSKVFKTNYVEEYGREYCNIKPPSEFKSEDFFNIAIEQNRRSNDATKKSNRYLFCDTDTIVTQCFHKLYIGEFYPCLDTLISIENYFHYFLLAPTIEFEQDNTREFENDREKQFLLIKSQLDKWNRKYTVIEEPDFFKRVEKIKFLINVI